MSTPFTPGTGLPIGPEQAHPFSTGRPEVEGGARPARGREISQSTPSRIVPAQLPAAAKTALDPFGSRRPMPPDAASPARPQVKVAEKIGVKSVPALTSAPMVPASGAYRVETSRLAALRFSSLPLGAAREQYCEPGAEASSPASKDALAVPTPQPEVEDDIPYAPSSRLSGLRNLVTGVNRHGRPEEYEPAGEAPTHAERVSERPVYAEPEAGQDIPTVGTAGQVETVTARPEILRPRPAESPDRERERVRPVPASPRRASQDERWDAPDDVDILPSWRGQYRKRRWTIG